MKNAAIVISNRNIKIDRNKSNSIFGNNLNSDGIKVATGQLENDKYNVKLVSQDDTSTHLNEFVSSIDNGKPWIFFVHGNNQTLKKNYKKSARIQKQYDANIVIFSWPSRTYKPPKLISYIIAGALYVTKKTSKIGKYFAKVVLRKRIKQYTEARKFADKSKLDLIDTLTLLKTNIVPNIQNRDNIKFTMLVHSLGNYLLQLAYETGKMDSYQNIFNSVVLHQADVTEATHTNWCNGLEISYDNKVYITKNKRDSILFMSSYINTKDTQLDLFNRLGNKVDGTTESENLNYIDLTGKKKVGYGHGLAWDNNMSKELEDIFMPIFT